MHRLIRSALVALAVLVLGPPRLTAAETITLLHVGDTHSHLDAVGPRDVTANGTRGGLVKAATVIRSLRAGSPNPLFVHDGDLFNGDLYFVAGIGPGGAPLLSVPELQLLAGLGLDAMVLGNHELGLGAEVLAKVLVGAFPNGGPAVLSSNVDLAAAGLAGLVQPRVVKQVGKVKVGFFGLTLADALAERGQVPFLSGGTTQDGLVAIASSEAAALRASPYQADVVVCLAHLGRGLEEAVAKGAPGIDVVVGAHDHSALEEPRIVDGPGGKQVPIVEAGEYYEWVGKLTLSVEGGVVSVADYELVPVDASVRPLPAVDAKVKALQAAIDLRYGEPFFRVPLAYALADVPKDVEATSPQRDSGIGNLLTDALRAAGGTDIGMTVNGFFTEGLSRGVLVRQDAFRIVGDGIDPDGVVLGFPVYRIHVTGANLAAALETALTLGDDFFVQVSGMRYAFDGSAPAGSRLRLLSVGGQDLDPNHAYSATVNLGLVLGLRQLEEQLQVKLLEDAAPIGIAEYAAVRDWMRSRRLILYASQGRILDVSKLH